MSQASMTMMYSSPHSVNDMQVALARVAIDELLDDLHAAGTFGVIVDESTDRSTDKTLIIHCGSKKTRQLRRTITTTQFSRF